MTKYRYFGFADAAYPDVVIPGEGSLYVKPGDVKELDENPDPRWFIEGEDLVAEWEASLPAEPAKPEPAPKSAGAKPNPDQVTVGE